MKCLNFLNWDYFVLLHFWHFFNCQFPKWDLWVKYPFCNFLHASSCWWWGAIAHQFICKVAQHEKALVQTHPCDERMHEIAIIVVIFSSSSSNRIEQKSYDEFACNCNHSHHQHEIALQLQCIGSKFELQTQLCLHHRAITITISRSSSMKFLFFFFAFLSSTIITITIINVHLLCHHHHHLQSCSAWESISGTRTQRAFQTVFAALILITIKPS